MEEGGGRQTLKHLSLMLNSVKWLSMPNDIPWTEIVLGAVVTIPIIGCLVCWAISRTPESSSLPGSRLKADSDIQEHIKEVLRKIDPLDSLYFDVSVSRHLLEEGNPTKALEWLDPNHALGELKKAVNGKFFTPLEFDEIGSSIIKIKEAVDGGRLPEAHAIIVPLQNRLAEKAYLTFKELDPIPQGYLDGRFEGARERKVAEWTAKGYPAALIEKTLKWADEWARGIARRFIKEPTMRAQVAETLYPEALELSERFIEAMAK